MASQCNSGYLIETCMGNFPQETAGNTVGAGRGIKLATIPRDGNLITENPAVMVRRIASQLWGIYRPRYRYCTYREIVLASWTNPGGMPHTAFCRLIWQFAASAPCFWWLILDLELSSVFDRILLHLSVYNFLIYLVPYVSIANQTFLSIWVNEDKE